MPKKLLSPNTFTVSSMVLLYKRLNQKLSPELIIAKVKPGTHRGICAATFFFRNESGVGVASPCIPTIQRPSCLIHTQHDTDSRGTSNPDQPADATIPSALFTPKIVCLNKRINAIPPEPNTRRQETSSSPVARPLCDQRRAPSSPPPPNPHGQSSSPCP